MKKYMSVFDVQECGLKALEELMQYQIENTLEVLASFGGATVISVAAEHYRGSAIEPRARKILELLQTSKKAQAAHDARHTLLQELRRAEGYGQECSQVTEEVRRFLRAGLRNIKMQSYLE